MVYLRRPMRRRQSDIVKHRVLVGRKLTIENRIDAPLSSRALDRRRPEVYADQEEKNKDY